MNSIWILRFAAFASILLIFLIKSSHAYPHLDCTRFVYAPGCRGYAMKRSLNQPEVDNNGFGLDRKSSDKDKDFKADDLNQLARLILYELKQQENLQTLFHKMIQKSNPEVKSAFPPKYESRTIKDSSYSTPSDEMSNSFLIDN